MGWVALRAGFSKREGYLVGGGRSYVSGVPGATARSQIAVVYGESGK